MAELTTANSRVDPQSGAVIFKRETQETPEQKKIRTLETNYAALQKQVDKLQKQVEQLLAGQLQ